MKEIIENQIKDFSSNDDAAQDFQVLDLGLTHKCWQKAVFKLNQGELVRQFRTSVSIENDELTLTLIRTNAPHEGMEFTRRLSSAEKEKIPTKIKSILEEQGFFHLTSIGDINLTSSGYPTNSPNEQMFVVIGYSASAILSIRTHNSTITGSLHGNRRAAVGFVSEEALRLPSSAWFRSTFNASNGYSVKEKARLKFNKFAKAKKLLATAGRSKPQGDLIIYFGENSCLAEGVNGVGAETMKLQNAASLKELDTYESEIETGCERATFNYPTIYAAMMSSSKGFSAPCGVEYGVDINGLPFVEFRYRGANYVCDAGDVKVKYTMRNNPAQRVETPESDLNILDMKNKSHPPIVVETVRLPNQIGSDNTTPTGTSDTTTSEINHELSSEETILVEQWRDAYIAYNTARGLSTKSVNPLEHFNAFMMHQIEQGNEIEKGHFDLYNSLK